MKTRVAMLVSVVLGAAAVGGVRAQVQIGDKVSSVTFVDRLYLPRSLGEFGERRGYVLFFVTKACPLVGRILPRVQRLASEFGAQGVQFVAVNVGRGDSVVDMTTQAVELGIDLPFGKDFDGSVLRAVGVDRTCTAVLLDGERRLRYRGRVDGAYRFSGPSPNPGREDLRAAIENLLADRDVEVAETPVEGCKVELTPRQKPSREVTFNRDLAPLVQRHCQECHRPDAEAPFSLLTYDDCADRGEMLAEVVAQQRMPPWYASPDHGHFINDRRLSDAERQTFADWVLGGMAEGDPADLPAPRSFVASAWRIDEPDLDLKVPVPIRVPAEGYIPYRYYVLPYRFEQDTWVQSIEIRPTNKNVLHHANLAYVMDATRYSQEGFITGQVPGGRPMELDDGLAVRIPAGAVLALQCHYVTTGKPEVDRLHVGLRFPRTPVRKRIRPLIVGHVRFEIPPGAPAHEVRRTKVLPEDAIGLGLFSHMHLRGKDMTFRTYQPDGTDQTLLVIPNYNFDWQDAYVFERNKLRFPKGTRVEVTAHFDNSAFNPFNPDPTVPVRFGPQTYHEMMYGFLFWVAEHEDLGLRVDPATGWAIGE